MIVDGTGKKRFELGREALSKTEEQARGGAVASSSHR